VLALPPDAELIGELRSVRLRETTPGVVRLDHDPDKHDDRAIALALCAHYLLQASEDVVHDLGGLRAANLTFVRRNPWLADSGPNSSGWRWNEAARSDSI
jgi:hypothetical protein